MLQSFQRLQRADPGFQARGLLAASLDLPDARYPGPAQRLAFAEDAAARIGRLPGVSGVAAANNLPLEGSMNGVVEVEGRAFEPDDRPNAEKRIVGDDYFRVMEIPLRAGRLFGPSDREGSPKVVIVSETAARRLWPGDTAVGKRIRSLTCGECWEEVVGVVGDVKEEALHRAAPMEIYYPLRQLPLGAMELVIRAGGDPEALVEPVRRAVAELDPTQPVHGIRTLRDVVAASVEDRRVSSFLLGAFAALAVLLAAVGVGGVVSYAVGRRTREIGLRMALGSTPRAVVRLVLGHGLRLAAGGLALGLPAALVLVRLLRAQLYEVEPGHPAAYLGGAALLALAVLAACYLPARRAARVDPLAALRYE
jgi:putative ABC transport system permease protein